MAKADSSEPNSSSQVEESRTLAHMDATLDKFLLVAAELVSLISLFLPWFTIKMSVPLMGIQMNGTYDFFLFNRMKISIEGLPGAFAGAIASEETILVNIHPLFWSPLIGAIVGLWSLIMLLRRKLYHKQAFVSSVLIILIALEMKFLSITIGKEALSDFVGLMESLGAELSFSSLGSSLFLIAGILMVFSQVFNVIRRT